MFIPSCWSSQVNVEHVDRFYKEFGTQNDGDNMDDNELTVNVANSKSQKPSKPSDHQTLLGGNCDDKFMMGIKFTR